MILPMGPGALSPSIALEATKLSLGELLLPFVGKAVDQGSQAMKERLVPFSGSKILVEAHEQHRHRVRVFPLPCFCPRKSAFIGPVVLANISLSINPTKIGSTSKIRLIHCDAMGPASPE